MLRDRCRVLDRVVDVVKEYLPDPGAAVGDPAAEIVEPAVVGLDAGAAALVLVRLRRAREQDEAREERRDRVREDDLTDNAVTVLLRVAHLVVPVAEPAGVAQNPGRGLVAAAPGVEVLVETRSQELPGLRTTSARVRGPRGQRVTIKVHGRLNPH